MSTWPKVRAAQKIYLRRKAGFVNIIIVSKAAVLRSICIKNYRFTRGMKHTFNIFNHSSATGIFYCKVSIKI